MPTIAQDVNDIARFIFTDAAGRVYVLLSDGTTTAFIEPSSGGLTISRAIHRRIELSNQWIASYKWAAVAAGADVFFHIKVGANKNPHGVIRISCEAATTFYIYENPTLTNDGTGLSEVCENRQTITVPDTTCFRDPVITANGLQLEIGTSGSDGKFTATAMQIENGGYFLLKKSESYLIRITNDDGAAQDISIAYMWHEE